MRQYFLYIFIRLNLSCPVTSQQIFLSFYHPIHKLAVFHPYSIFPYSSSSLIPAQEQLTLLCNFNAVTIVTFSKIPQPLMSCLALHTHTHGYTHTTHSQMHRIGDCGMYVPMRVCRCIGGCVGAGMWGE